MRYPKSVSKSEALDSHNLKFKKSLTKGFFTKYIHLATTDTERLAVYYLNDLTEYFDEDNLAHLCFEHLTQWEVVNHKANNLPYFLKTYAPDVVPGELVAGVTKWAGAYWLETGGIQFEDLGNHKPSSMNRVKF